MPLWYELTSAQRSSAHKQAFDFTFELQKGLRVAVNNKRARAHTHTLTLFLPQDFLLSFIRRS